jgi:hypothetical protein
MWPSRLDRLKNNLDGREKCSFIEKKSRRHFFFKYWNDNMLDRLKSTQVNLTNLLHESWDLDNSIESK